MENIKGKDNNVYLIRTLEGTMFAGRFHSSSNHHISITNVVIFSSDEQGYSILRPDPLTDGKIEFVKSSLTSINAASKYLTETYESVMSVKQTKDMINEMIPQIPLTDTLH